MTPQGLEDLEPVLLRHLHVEQHELGVEVGDRRERRFAVRGYFNFMPLGPHAVGHDLSDCRIIIDDEYASDCHDEAIIQIRT